MRIVLQNLYVVVRFPFLNKNLWIHDGISAGDAFGLHDLILEVGALNVIHPSFLDFRVVLLAVRIRHSTWR